MFSHILVFINTLLITSAFDTFNIFTNNDFKPKNLNRLSPQCISQYNSSTILTLATMFDASVKIPNGIGYLNFNQLGDFDECYNLQQAIDGDDTIYGKYCLGTVPFPGDPYSSIFPKLKEMKILDTLQLVPRMIGSNAATRGWHIGYCIPSGCSAQDLKEILPFVYFDERYCQSKKTEEDLTPGGIATVSIISIFIGIVIISTIFDAALYYMEKKSPHEVLIAFSALSNGKKLITATRNPDQLLCLNGIRAISMMWVLSGHMYSLVPNSPTGTYVPIMKWMEETKNMFMIGAPVSVDTFFAAGGIVTVYVFLKSVDKGVKFNIILYYIHRYLRLTPALGVIIALHATVIDKIGNGPLWYPVKGNLALDCQNNWWSALLYIQNFLFLSDKPMCVPQSWYLSVDFQLFLLSPLVLLPLKWKPKIGLALLGLFIAAGIIIPFAIGFHYQLPAYTVTVLQDPEALWNTTKLHYIQTHTRFGPYVIGMLVGYFIYHYKKNKVNLKLKPVVYLSIWALTISGLIACVYSSHDDMNTYERWRDSFSLALLRNSWAVCVCSVVFMCVFGYGGIIDWFLSLPIFQFITKLSYSIYLVHYAVILMFNASQRYNMPFSNFYMFWSFWGFFMLSLGLSIILCLTFESPIMILEKYIFGGAGKVKKEEKKIEKPPENA